MSKKQNKIKGNRGEDLACQFLEKNGYQIILRNFNCIYGEIDIIATDRKELVFIEVKRKCQNKFGQPIEAITPVKLKHIYNTAQYYIYISNSFNTPIRFDAIEIYDLNDENSSIIHTKKIILDNPSQKQRSDFYR